MPHGYVVLVYGIERLVLSHRDNNRKTARDDGGYVRLSVSRTNYNTQSNRSSSNAASSTVCSHPNNRTLSLNRSTAFL